MRSNWLPLPGPQGGPPLLLDGGMGTALQAAGLGDALPEAWLLERPEVVAAVHRAHVAAGARLLLTSTFNAGAPRAAALLAGGRLLEACQVAVRLARTEAAGRALVAGALGPLAVVQPGVEAAQALDLGRPLLPALQALAEAGVDLLWLESQYDRREATAALAAARAFGLPVVLTYTFQPRAGRLQAPDGTPAEALLREAADGGAAAVGVNCLEAGPALEALAAWAAEALPVPFVAKPSPGLPGAVLSPAAFAAALAPAVAAGAWLVGGCCGATAGHVAALRAMLRASPGAGGA